MLKLMHKNFASTQIAVSMLFLCFAIAAHSQSLVNNSKGSPEIGYTVDLQILELNRCSEMRQSFSGFGKSTMSQVFEFRKRMVLRVTNTGKEPLMVPKGRVDVYRSKTTVKGTDPNIFSSSTYYLVPYDPPKGEFQAMESFVHIVKSGESATFEMKKVTRAGKAEFNASPSDLAFEFEFISWPYSSAFTKRLRSSFPQDTRFLDDSVIANAQATTSTTIQTECELF